VSTQTLKSGTSLPVYIHIPTCLIHFNYSAHLVKWITENNRPVNIINDRELRDLLMAGRPSIQLPSNFTISRDINATFEKCQQHIAKLLQVCLSINNICTVTNYIPQEHPGRVHFATDAWTSPNHRAFVAWTVHLEYKGEMLAFLLDIAELPEVHSSQYHKLCC
jgi:hypothetical protein